MKSLDQMSLDDWKRVHPLRRLELTHRSVLPGAMRALLLRDIPRASQVNAASLAGTAEHAARLLRHLQAWEDLPSVRQFLMDQGSYADAQLVDFALRTAIEFHEAENDRNIPLMPVSIVRFCVLVVEGWLREYE